MNYGIRQQKKINDKKEENYKEIKCEFCGSRDLNFEKKKCNNCYIILSEELLQKQRDNIS